MTYQGINDPIFAQAVEAIDTGNLALLKKLIDEHPSLVADRLNRPTGGYFDRPYLLWFVADNPIRNGKLPGNIVKIIKTLVDAVKQNAPASAIQQVNYALELVITGLTPRESGLQTKIMDVLIDSGASPIGGVAALANGNIDAAKYLLKRGEKLSLAIAAGLDMTDEGNWLLPKAGPTEQTTALTLAAFYGNAAMIRRLLAAGIDPNSYPEKESGFHSHATPLHQAVSSGSPECVKLLVEAGARTDAIDQVYKGTPLGWAIHMGTEPGSEEMREKYKAIADYLRG